MTSNLSKKKFTITPLGSCRITTPLRISRETYGYETEASRIYGFCHSSAEAIQLLHFMREETQPPREIWPLIARGRDYDEMATHPFQPADAYVVEISSAKQITLDGWCVQLNYLANEYRAFFEDKQRTTAFWAAARQDDQDKIDAVLKDWPYPEETAMLRRVRQSITTREQLKADMAQLLETLKDVLFVTHVNARTPEGDVLGRRAELIEMVEEVGAELGVAVYNPTPAMEAMGQEVAIADHSDSLAHYTEEFSHEIAGHWFDLKLAQVFDERVVHGGVPVFDGPWKAHFGALMVNAQFRSLEERMRALAEQRPDIPGIPVLRSKLALSFGDHEDAIVFVKDALSKNPEDERLQQSAQDLAIELKQFDMLLDIVKLRFEGERPVSSQSLQEMGEHAMRHGESGIAAEFFAMALDKNRSLSRSAEALADIALNDRPEAVSDLDEKLIQRLLAAVKPSTQMELFRRALISEEDYKVDWRKVSADELQQLISESVDSEGLESVATMVEEWRLAHDKDTLVHKGLRQFFDTQIEELDDTLPPQEQLATINAVLKAAPRHAGARVAQRNLRRDVLEKARSYYGASDIDALDALDAEVSDLSDPIKELALFRARLRFDKGEFEEAMLVGEDAASQLPDNISIYALLMRSAVKIGEWLKVEHYAQSVLELADLDTERLELEARNRLEKTPIYCLRDARTEEDALRLIQLLRVASREPERAGNVNAKIQSAEREIINELRSLQVAEDDTFPGRLEKAIAVLGPDPRILQAGGRFFVKSRDFATAARYWQQILESSPENEEAAFQLTRCRERLGQTNGPDN